MGWVVPLPLPLPLALAPLVALGSCAWLFAVLKASRRVHVFLFLPSVLVCSVLVLVLLVLCRGLGGRLSPPPCQNLSDLVRGQRQPPFAW